MNKIFLLVSLCAVFLIPQSMEAGPIIRNSEKISIDSSESLKGDFYGLASSITVSGPAEHDMYVAGQKVTITAPVAEDLVILGGEVQVHGDIGDDLRVIGADVTLAKTVKGDVVVLGGTLTVLPTAVIEGDILFMGIDLLVEGNVAGSIFGKSEHVRIDGEVGKDISYTAGSSFTLGDKARVQGGITYEGLTTIVQAQNSEVAGEIHRMESKIPDSQSFLKIYIAQVCVLVFAALVFFLAFKKRLQAVFERTVYTLPISGLVGLGVFLIIPFISSVLIVSVLGVFLGIALLILYFFMLLVSLVCAGIFLGIYLQTFIMKKKLITFGTVGIGVCIFSALAFVPYLGPLLMFACVIVTLGGISMSLYRLVRS